MTDDFETQLDQIRVELYEQTKNMSNMDAIRVINENARKIAKQYGIKIVKGTEIVSSKSAHAI